MTKPGRFERHAWAVSAYNTDVVLWGAFARAANRFASMAIVLYLIQLGAGIFNLALLAAQVLFLEWLQPASHNCYHKGTPIVEMCLAYHFFS